MSCTGDMDELEIEEEDTGYPPVDCCVGLNVGVVQHPFDILRVDFNDEVTDPNDPQASGAQASEQPIELELRLRIIGLTLIEPKRLGYRAVGLSGIACVSTYPIAMLLVSTER